MSTPEFSQRNKVSHIPPAKYNMTIEDKLFEISGNRYGKIIRSQGFAKLINSIGFISERDVMPLII